MIGDLARRGLSLLLRRWAPRLDGKLTLRGIGAPIEIARDRWGVPHIRAMSVEDALFAQGFVHAQDRFWQMELNRRVGHGRLAEAFGERAFATDKLLRVIGLARAARASLDQCDDESRRTLEAYARGVNAFLEGKRPSVEHALLRLRADPWAPVDSLVWTQMMAWGLSTNWDAELVTAALVGRLGPEKAARLLGEYPEGNPLVLAHQTAAPLAERALEHLRAAREWIGVAGFTGMSNNWVVSAEKSSTGAPLLANDPHLSLAMPSIWYEVHLSAPGLDVAGVSLPGVPGVVIGHNTDVAWGLTAALPDTQDLYLERLRGDEYEVNGAWRKLTMVREEIRVKGERAPRVVEIPWTRHGPLIESTLGALSPAPSTGVGISLRWVGHEPGSLPRASLRIARAKNWSEFRAAMEDWTAPAMNVVYADREGNIAYRLSGRIPRRKKGLGFTPVPGWTDEYEWDGLVPFDEMPEVVNPKTHYLASANNRITGDEYPHFLGWATMNGYRARRIGELLTEKQKLSAADFARIQRDLYCAPAAVLTRMLVEAREPIVARSVHRAQAAAALEALARWDLHLTAESVAGAIYEITQHFGMRRLFTPHLGPLTEAFCGIGFHPVIAPVCVAFLDRSFLVFHRILLERSSEWLTTSREELLAAALDDAIAWLEQEVGPEPASWTWGRVHQAGFHHPLGINRALDAVFSRGPLPYGGDINTVWQASWVPRLPIKAEGGFTASWRQILDLGDWDRSRGGNTTGQSGHPGSPHYDDQIAPWLRGETHPLPFSRAAVDAAAAHRLVLEPR